MKIAQIISEYDIKELICESYPHILYRATHHEDGRAVVIKTLSDKFPKKETIAALRREFHITQRLQGKGIIRVYDYLIYGQGNVALILEDFGISLEAYVAEFPRNQLPLGEFFAIANSLIDILGRMHEKNFVHKDLNPSNILIDPKTKELRIIDFGSTTELSQENPSALRLNQRIEGSLPFISPEQTGRINRGIDYRTDYYSIGISFYLLLSGKLPFSANDPLEWVHHHIGKEAVPPKQFNKSIPPILSAIIMKLIAKNAEDRYQSPFGLLKDLAYCEQVYLKKITDSDFELGKNDNSAQFTIPQKLYGREKELAALELSFEHASNGAVEFSLVAGYSGIGKTALVNELSRSIVTKHGYLIQGKFEQFKQNAPYVALANAFRNLLKQLLGEPTNRLEQWAKEIKKALGAHAQLIIDIIPELEFIIGKQDLVLELSPVETQIRFQNLFISFVDVFAKEEHPLVIFLDDLQWSDVPTLNLLNRLVVSQDLGHLLLIGTYRDNEVEHTHPLDLTIREIQKKRIINMLTVKELDIDITLLLIQDTLHCTKERASEIGNIIYEKSRGNPFFTIELLKNLKERKVIQYNPTQNIWEWDLAAVNSIEYSDNVIDILLESQLRLKKRSLEILKLAACIGTSFDLKTLAIIRKKDTKQTALELVEAIQTKMILPLDESFSFLELQDIGLEQKTSDFNDSLNPRFRFQHDRVQQAAYSQITLAKRKALHLSIGRIFLVQCTEQEKEERLMEIVGHLNAGKTLLKKTEDLLNLARLNLEAGIKAKQSSAYEEALHFLNIGRALLEDDTWEIDYLLSWQLCYELQQCLYLTGDYAKADQLTEYLLGLAKTPTNKALLYASRTRQYATTGKMRESIDSAFLGLSLLGFDFIANPSKKNIDEEVALINSNLGNRAIADLIKMPEIKDERVIIANKLIMESFAAAFLSGSGEMFPYLVLKSANIALTSGNSPESAFAYAAYAMILCGYFDDAKKGFEYGNLAVRMIEKFEDISLKSRIIYLYTMFVHHWSNHWSSMTPWFHKGIEAGYQSGDLLYLAYSAQDCIIWDPMLDLEPATLEHRKLLQIVKECEYQDSLDSGTLFLQMQLNFQGLTKSMYSLSDEHFDEDDCVAGMNERHFMTGISNYMIYKTEIHLMYNDPSGALRFIEMQDERMESVMSLPQIVRYHFSSFMVRAALLGSTDEATQKVYLNKMQISLDRMGKWSENCPENFEHLRLLMEAALADHYENFELAFSLYERAISQANTTGFRRDEAFALESTAKFLLQHGFSKAAEGYIQSAHYSFYQWGAHRKVEELEKTYPAILHVQNYQITHSTNSTSLRTNSSDSSDFSSEHLDIGSVLKASQTISGELVLAKLLTATLDILIENAGAEKGFLVELIDGKLHVKASKINREKAFNHASFANDNVGGVNLPINLINAAIRSKQAIVLGNASELNAYSSDPYISKQGPLSVMCVPLPSHSETYAAVYLENNLTHSAFTDDRVEIIKLLAGQASISLENARIYQEQANLLKAQRRFVPTEFLEHLGHRDIAKVALGESVSMEMSVLFSDIRGFTRIVELLSPQEVIELLNRYFSQVCTPITQAGGFIDSYAGDALLALFAVPTHDAVKAGIQMREALRTFNRIERKKGQAELKIGIGMNTGPLVLGTMGGLERMQCSVLGDTVNLASRIESLTKYYHSQFILGEGTYLGLKNPEQFSIRMIDRVAVKGKGQAVTLYEVLDAEDESRRKAKEASLSVFEQSLTDYYAKNFKLAMQGFTEALVIDPIDEVIKIYIQRCENHILNPPPVDWQGFEKFDHK